MLLNDDTANSSVYIEIIIRQILLIIGSINVITHACFGLRKQHVYCPSKNSIHNVIDEYRAGKNRFDIFTMFEKWSRSELEKCYQHNNGDLWWVDKVRWPMPH